MKWSSMGLLAAVLAAAPAWAETALEITNNRVFVPATVGGKTVSALLDTGAEMTLVDDDFARELGLALVGNDEAKGSGGTASVRFAENVDIHSAGVALPKTTIAVLDLADVSMRLAGRPVSVVLGREFFDAGRVRIDIQRASLSSVSRDEEPAGTALALTTQKGIETFPASVEGQAPVQAVLDIGNGSDVLIGKAYADRLGLTAPDRIVERRSGGGIGGPIMREIVLLKSLTIAGRTFENVHAAVDPTESAADLNIGTSLLREFVMTIDYPQRRLWLEPRNE